MLKSKDSGVNIRKIFSTLRPSKLGTTCGGQRYAGGGREEEEASDPCVSPLQSGATLQSGSNPDTETDESGEAAGRC